MWPDRAIKNRAAAGFTLIELLVVVLIIGITVGLVVISINPDRSDDVKVEAQRLQELIKLASQEAILQGNEYALEFSDDAYRFLVLAQKKWLPVEDPLLRERTMPKTVRLEVIFDGERFDFMKTEEEENPRIYLFSSGEITPVDILLEADDDADIRFHVITDIGGKISLSTDPERP